VSVYYSEMKPGDMLLSDCRTWICIKGFSMLSPGDAGVREITWLMTGFMGDVKKNLKYAKIVRDTCMHSGILIKELTVVRYHEIL
jgi:hypothetical protein